LNAQKHDHYTLRILAVNAELGLLKVMAVIRYGPGSLAENVERFLSDSIAARINHPAVGVHIPDPHTAVFHLRPKNVDVNAE